MFRYGLKPADLEAIPFEVTGLDSDGESEFINHDLIDWAVGRKIFFTRSRPYKKNDQATVRGHLRVGHHAVNPNNAKH